MWEHQPHLHGRAICEFDPHVQKFHIHLLSKTLVSKIDQNNGLFSMEPDQRATLALSRCAESNGANGSSIRGTVMILWHVESHLLQAFRDTCRIPTRGIEWKPCIKKGFRWVVQACLGMCYVGTLEKCIELIITYYNLVFNYNKKLLTLNSSLFRKPK